MTNPVAVNVYAQNTGTTSTAPLLTFFEARNPNPQDINFLIQQRWVNTLTDELWILEAFSSLGGVITAVWSKNGSGNLAVETLTGNDAVPVPSSGPPNYNINVVGNNAQGINTTGNAGTNTLTITAFDATTAQKGVSRLATNAETIAGALTTNVVINPDDLKAKLGPQTQHGVIIGEGQTAALSATAPGSFGDTLIGQGAGADPIFAHIGTDSGLTATGIVVAEGNSPFQSLGNAFDGYLPIGSTGTNPVLAPLTSADGTITITNGAGSIDLSAATSEVLKQYIYTTDGGAYFSTAATFNPNNTIPTSASGAAFMNLSITPMSAANRLLIRFQCQAIINKSVNSMITCALFRDANVNAICVGAVGGIAFNDNQLDLVFQTTAGAAVATTFFIRLGAQQGGGGTVSINGENGTRFYGGVQISTLEIFEIGP